MEPKHYKVKWWNWLLGLLPILAYFTISIIVANALQQNPQNGGWSIILYGIVPQISIISVVVNCIYLFKIKCAPINEKWGIGSLVFIDVAIMILCILAFMGHPEIAIFWWYWFN